MRNKKSQLSLFMIIGIVIVVVVIIVLIMSGGNTLLLFLKQTKNPLQYYMEECMRIKLVDGIEIISAQGGFIYVFAPNLTTTNRVFAYSTYKGANSSPSNQFMENELASYIENNINGCVGNYTLPITVSGFPDAKVQIFPESVMVELKYQLEVMSDDSSVTFSNFRVRQMVPLGRMVELRNTVVKDLLDYPNLMLLDKLYDTDFEMYINPYSGKIKVIDMINTSSRLRNSPLKFSFGLYDDHILPPVLDFQGTLPNITVKVGIPYMMQIQANHHCKFYDNTVLFDIGEDTGIIKYTPSELDIGSYNITLTLDDDVFRVSKRFKLTVAP